MLSSCGAWSDGSNRADQLCLRPNRQERSAPGVIQLPTIERFSPNHGPRPEPARIDMLVLHYTGMATAEAALERLREQCSTVFVGGLSMGALLALKLAADHPSKIDGVATLSATFFYDGWNVPRFKQRYLLPLLLGYSINYQTLQ